MQNPAKDIKEYKAEENFKKNQEFNEYWSIIFLKKKATTLN